MTDFYGKYGTEEDITHTLASLADGASVAGSEIDNSSNLNLDYLVRYSIKSGTGVSSSGKIYFYAVAAIDDSGRTYPTNNVGGNLLGLPMDMTADATTYTSQVYSVRKAFGGVLPKYFKIVVLNKSGAALDSTESNHDKRGQGVKRQFA